MRIILAVAVLAALISCGPAQAANEEDWSFLLHPAVPLFEFTNQQSDRFFAGILTEDPENSPHRCDRDLDRLIDIYIETYPGFAYFARQPEWRQRWIDAFAVRVYRDQLDCAVIDPALKTWLDYSKQLTPGEGGKPYFCGRFTDREVPEKFSDAIHSLVSLAFEKNSHHAAWILMAYIFRNRNPVDLNADAAFYLVQRYAWMKAKGADVPEAEDFAAMFDSYGYSLPPERRREVVEAAHSGDAKAILDTTPDCAPYRESASQSAILKAN
jgi:hypothetical protein